MLAFKLALRNVFAHFHRNLVIFLVVALVTALLFLFLAFSDGEIENIRENVGGLLSPYADIKVYARGFREAQEAGEEDMEKYFLKQAPYLVGLLAGDPLIKEIYDPTNRLTEDLFTGGKKYNGFMIAALDPAGPVERKIRLIEGSSLRPGEPNTLLVHHVRKDLIRAAVGDTVTVVGRDLFGQLVSQDFRLKGYFAPQIDNPNLYDLVFVDQRGYALISGLYEGEAVHLNIVLRNGADFESALQSLRKRAVEDELAIEFRDSREDNRGFAEIYETLKILIAVMCGIIIFIVSFGIMNVVSVNLFDRKTEVGTYYCLGAERPFLRWMYTLEILAVNAVGTLAGLALGLGVRLAINLAAFETTEPGLQLVFGGSRFVLGFSWISVLGIAAGVVAVTLVTCLASLGKSLRVSPAEAVREME